MPTGSGAIVVHRMLADGIPGYHVSPFHPAMEYVPPLLALKRDRTASLIHSTPDHGAMVARKGQPLVVTFHNFVLDAAMRAFSTWPQRLHYSTDLLWLSRKAVRQASVVTAVSAFTAGLVEHHLGVPAKVIENGIDLERFYPSPRGNPSIVRVLVSGNASLRKGTHWLDAICDLLMPEIELTCTIAPRIIRRWVRKDTRVRTIGKVAHSQMPQLYRDFDILLMPTVREGLSMAVMEAMASGLPVVAADNSSLPELVHDGRGGYLCETGDVAAFAERLNALAIDPEKRAEFGAYNRTLAEHRFSRHRMLNAYRELFETILGVPLQESTTPSASRGKSIFGT